MADGNLPGRYPSSKQPLSVSSFRDQYTPHYPDSFGSEAGRQDDYSQSHFQDESAPTRPISALSKRKSSWYWPFASGSRSSSENTKERKLLRRKSKAKRDKGGVASLQIDMLKQSREQQTKSHQQEMENLKAELQRNIHQEIERSVHQEQETREQAMENLKAEYERYINQEREVHEKEVERVWTEREQDIAFHKHEMEQLETKYDEENEAHEQEIERLKAKQNQDSQAHKQEMERLRTLHKKEMDRQQARSSKSIDAITSQLQSAKVEVAELQKHIKKNETVITRAHETMMSSLSKSVSRPITDDMIKDELKQFYQNDFLSWCADLSFPAIAEPETAKGRLQAEGIINNTEDYLREPINMQFSMGLPHGRSSLVLLQAVLSQTLCQTFLRDAYFLVEEMEMSKMLGGNLADSRQQLKELEDLFQQVDKDIGVDWRIQTVEALEKAIPLDMQFVENKAKAFVQDFQFLLAEVNDQALEDLAQLFVDFGTMALKFWKMRTIIKAHGLSRFADEKFDVDSPYVEADIVGSLAVRRHLQGRPIGVVTRPLIISEPLGQDGEANTEVVWLKAAGWVSDYKTPVDSPMQGLID